MINIILSLVIGAASWVLTTFLTESVWAGLLPFLIVTLVVFIVLGRLVSRKVSALMGRAQSIMANLQSLPSEQARKIQMDKATEIIKEAYRYKNYQVFLTQQLNSQIGTMYYVQKKFKEAEPYLKDSFVQPGTARAMYACILFKRKDVDAMKTQFEASVKIDKKTPLLWNLYAWCLNELKQRDEAIAVLNRCLKYTPNDKITQDNLSLIKNSGKIKMRVYEMQWYQFWLDEPPRQQMISPFAKRQSFKR